MHADPLMATVANATFSLRALIDPPTFEPVPLTYHPSFKTWSGARGLLVRVPLGDASRRMLFSVIATTWTRRMLPGALAFFGIVFVLNLISFAFGVAPLGTLRAAAVGTWGTPYGIGQVLFKATPLILTGLSFEVAFRAGLFNIGGEGQLAAGGLAGAVVASRLPTGTPAFVALPLVLLIAMLAGALIALVPALLRARRGVHEIISTIMMNRIADILVPYLLVTLAGGSSVRTPDIIPSASLPRLDRAFSALSGSAASTAFPLAVILAFGLHRLLVRTRVGREMRWVGQNANACRAQGIDVPRRLVQAMMLSGALSGAVMAATVLGYKGYFELGIGSGAGFTGVAVALLGRGNPLGIVLAALLFGTLDQAGLAINARVPREAMSVLTACAILVVAAGARAAERATRVAPAATGTVS